MKIYFVSIFPEIFDSFLSTSLIQKAQDKSLLEFSVINPRDFCEDKHRQVDDIIYWWGAWMLMKVKPVVDAIESIMSVEWNMKKTKKTKIVYLAPSEEMFCQERAHEMSELDVLILVCGRYEGIDHRFELYMQEKYPEQFSKISMGKFVTLGWELPAMTMVESIVRLVPWVIKESESREKESYSIEKNMSNIEHPQYTRPEEILGMKVPEVLLSGHHKKIEEWKDENEQRM